ncbi:unnamed protein product [Sphagnum jensenii]|uniref:Exocyst complex component Sec8 n=1 Tax=Sphagnum jensenii TaxID=128206 RepID=A0ABP1AID8_9BRYO
MSMANRLPADDLEEVTRDVSRIYVQAMYSVTAIVAERDTRNRKKTDATPPVLPLEIAGPSIIKFTELLFEHEERLRHSFLGTIIEEVVSNEFEQLVRLISRDSNLKAALMKGSEDSDFGKAWRPLVGGKGNWVKAMSTNSKSYMSLHGRLDRQKGSWEK